MGVSPAATGQMTVRHLVETAQLGENGLLVEVVGVDAAIADIKEQAAALQQSQEAPEDTSCLPILELADIEVAEQTTPFRTEVGTSSKTFWFTQPTNGITYLNLQFDISGLDNELRPYLPIFCTLLPQIGAAGHDYLAMARRITAATGGRGRRHRSVGHRFVG